MPIYQYECRLCKEVTEKFHRMDSIPKKVRCATPGCGRMARRIIASSGAIRCDSINDVKWLPSAIQNLPDDARRIGSRAEHSRYLKEHNLVCKG
jgi:putative FmdB family regulatory protein